MSGISAMFFGGSIYAFMGAWDMSSATPFTDDYGGGMALGYTANNEPYVVMGASTDTFTDRANALRVDWQRGTVWTAYADTGGDAVTASGCVLDTSGNSYTIVNNTSGTDTTILVKYDTSGVMVWQRELSDPTDLRGMFLGIDSSDNVYVSGRVDASSGTAVYVFIAKYNSSGTIQWQRTLTSSYQGANLQCMSVSSSGDVVLGGYYTPSFGADNNIFIAKYNSSGTLQWQKAAAWVTEQYLSALVQDGSGNIYGLVYGYSGIDFSTGVRIFKLNSSGTETWCVVRNGAYPALYPVSSYRNGSATIDSNGDVYFLTAEAGLSVGSGLVLHKVNSSGTVQYVRSFSNTTTGTAPTWSGIVTDTYDFMWVQGAVSYGTTYGVFLARLPFTGTLTGTYALPTPSPRSVVYASETRSFGSTTLGLSALSFTDAAGALTDGAGVFTFGTFSTTAYTVDA